jgi:NADH-quinone oxidoreductase E subunit
MMVKDKDLIIEDILQKYPKNDKDNLIQILNEVQETKGYIPEKAMLSISDYLGVTMSEIYSVVSFYSRFTLKPKGKYHVSVCLGTACFVKGSEKLLDSVKEKLKIEAGETTKDGKFSLEEIRCLGACGLAQVFTVNEEVYGKATVKMVDEILDNLIKEG